jgi:hypothetical protein
VGLALIGGHPACDEHDLVGQQVEPLEDLHDVLVGTILDQKGVEVIPPLLTSQVVPVFGVAECTI